MKKSLYIIVLLPVLILLIGILKYHVQLNGYFDRVVPDTMKAVPIQNTKKTEVHIIGTMHFETESVKKDHFYRYLDSIGPSIILYEGDSTTVRRIANKTDYLIQAWDALRNRRRIEKPVTLKYLKNNPECILLPYEWEERTKFHRKHKYTKRLNEMINAIIKLSRSGGLSPNETALVDRFLELYKLQSPTDQNGSISDINSIRTDSILNLRQHYIYRELPKIVADNEDLAQYNDFAPIHMNYWDTRNQAMVYNILQHIKHHPNNVIVVLTGFYHRYYLRNRLSRLEMEYDFVLK